MLHLHKLDIKRGHVSQGLPTLCFLFPFLIGALNLFAMFWASIIGLFVVWGTGKTRWIFKKAFLGWQQMIGRMEVTNSTVSFFQVPAPSSLRCLSHRLPLLYWGTQWSSPVSWAAGSIDIWVGSSWSRGCPWDPSWNTSRILTNTRVLESPLVSLVPPI